MRLTWNLQHFLLLWALAVGCQTANPDVRNDLGGASSGTSGPIRLTLIGTNDLHGWVYPLRVSLPGGGTLSEGGSATFAGYLKILRADNPAGTLLLDAGDLFQGTLASNLTEGEVVIQAYNALGYQAAAVGNHEFDYGPVGPISVASQPGVDPFGALKERLKQAHFPLLAVNIYDAKTGERPPWLGNDGTTIVEIKGVKIGILGLVTPSTPFTTNPVNVSSLRFGGLAPEAKMAAKKLRERGAEIVIAVTHAGGRCQNWENPSDTTSCDVQSSELFEMMDQLPSRTVDAVIAGHTHAVMGHYVKGVPVIETPGQGRSFGTIELFIDPKSHKILTDRTIIHPAIAVCEQVDEATQSCDPRRIKDLKAAHWVPATFLGKPVEKDVALEKMLEPALARVEADQHRKLGIRLPEPLTRNYDSESSLGEVLADALREMEGADVSFLNPGGIRADLPAGELTYGAVYEVVPFDNTVAILTVTGDELMRLLAAAFSGRKGVFQVSGVTVELAACPGQGRFKGATLLDGKAIVPDKNYRIAVPDFLARGGDGLGPVVTALPSSRIDLGTTRELNFRDALVAHWQKKTKVLVAPKGSRISYVGDAHACGPTAKAQAH